MYEMLSGYNPFIKDSTNVGQLLSKTLLFDPSPIQNCHPIITKLIEWCIKKQAHRRPANAEIILARLKEAMS